jgi:Tol biopolymer transport system component
MVLTACSSAGGSGGGGPASVAESVALTPNATADVAVNDGDAWVAFQSLADQFDPAADQDGIDGDDTIFMVRPDGTGLHRLPPEDLVGSEIRPTWSPDGSQVAFLRGHLSDERTELWTINADGSQAQLRFTCEAPCNTIDYPDWGASGRFIYFQRDTVPEVEGPPSVFEIYRLDLSTGEAASVLRREDTMSVEFARISPDETRAVYVRARNLLSDDADPALFIGTLDGSREERQLTDWSMHVAYPDWSGDNMIVFNSYDLRLFPETTEAANIYRIYADGTDLVQLTDYGTNDTRATQPRWLSDGSGFVYTLVKRSSTDTYGDRELAFLTRDGDADESVLMAGIVGTHPELRPLP